MTHAAILESEIAEQEPVAASEPAPAPPGGYVYTTGHEIQWLDELAKAHKLDVLLKLRAVYKVRDWSQPGMSVDRRRVIKHLDKLIERLQAGRRARD